MDQKAEWSNRVGLSKLLTIPAVIVGWAVGIFVGRFEPAAMAVAAGESTVVVLTAAIMLRDARREAWYWMFLAVVGCVHAISVILIPWPKHHNPGKGDILLALPDMVIVLVIGFWLAKAIKSPAHQNA